MCNTVDAHKNSEEEKGIEQRRGNLSIFQSSIYEAGKQYYRCHT